MLPATGALGPIEPMTGFALLALAMFIFGLLNGCADIALFTVRQRRTDPAWMGRAFAVSMAFNFMGFPIGAAIAGRDRDRVAGRGGDLRDGRLPWSGRSWPRCWSRRRRRPSRE